MRGFGSESHERLDGGAGLQSCAGFQPAAEQDQANDDGGGLVVDLRHLHVIAHEPFGPEGRDDRIEIGGRGADGNQGGHVGRAMPGSRKGGLVELPSCPNLDRRGEHEHELVQVLHAGERLAAEQPVGPVHEQHQHGRNRQADPGLERELAQVTGALRLALSFQVLEVVRVGLLSDRIARAFDRGNHVGASCRTG